MTIRDRSVRWVAAVAFSAALGGLLVQPAAAAHAVRRSGSGSIKPTWGADFDKGIFNGNSSAAEDLSFHIVTDSDRYLDPYGSARMRRVGSSKPSYSKCATAALADVEFNVATLSPGTWFCLKTQQGRFVRFRFDSVDLSPGRVHVTYTTWEL